MRIIAPAADGLGQHQVDVVTREDEAGNTGARGHVDRDRAHARSEGRSKEAAVAGLDQCALSERLTGRGRKTHDRAKQLAHIGLALNEVGILDHIFGPQLEADRICGDDRAGRQSPLGNQYLGTLRNLFRIGFSLRSGSAGKQTACGQRRADRDDQSTKQQQKFLLVHGFASPLEEF